MHEPYLCRAISGPAGWRSLGLSINSELVPVPPLVEAAPLPRMWLKVGAVAKLPSEMAAGAADEARPLPSILDAG